MRTRNDYHFIVVLIFASIALALVSMASLSSVRLGLDFGKDTRLVVSTTDGDSFAEYIDNIESKQVETRIRMSDGGAYVLEASGVESGTDFAKNLESNVIGSKVLLLGTFGSMTKFLNNQSFVVMCLFVFIVILGIYYIARYHFAGWYLWLISGLSIFTTLLILMASGFAFNQHIWFALLLSFIALFYLNTVLFHSKTSYKEVLWVCITFIIAGASLYFTVHKNYQPSALYFVYFGLVSSVLYILHYKYFADIFHGYIEGKVFALNDLFEIQDSDSIIFSRALGVTLIFILVGALLSLSRGTNFLNSSISQTANFLIFDRSDSATYLEVQARLNKLELFDNQVNYRVSEQGQTWLEFDDTLSLQDLELAAYEINTDLGLKVFYYQTAQESFFNGSGTYVIATFIMLLLGSGLLFMIRSYRFVSWYALTWAMAHLVFMTLSSFFGLQFTFSWYLVLLFMPISLVLVLMRFALNHIKSFRTYFVESLISSVMLMILMSFPVLIIFPVPRNAEMMLVFLVLFLAIHAAMGIASWIMIKGRHRNA